MISPARRVCFKLLAQIESKRLFSDTALNSDEMAQLEVRDRHLTTEIVYGTLRWQGTIDYILASASSQPLDEIDRDAKIMLRMSIYQMWKMDKIPDHALVNDAVELAKKSVGKGIDRFVNAVLRKLAKIRPWKDPNLFGSAPPWSRVSLPQWLWERWAARFGEKAAEEYGLSLTKAPRQALRLDDEYSGSLSPDVVEYSDLVPGAGFRLCGLAEEKEAFNYQDEASQLIPNLMGHLSGMSLWDACAAPGGKSLILSRLCGERGLVLSSDASKERALKMADLLNSKLKRKACVLVADASKPAPFRRQFDAVLVDVPCSGLGTLRRNPEIKWGFSPEDFESLQSRQAAILESASAAVCRGGLLLYSTCSTEPEEDEMVIESFVRTHPEFKIEKPSLPAGIENWTGTDSMVRTFPSERLWDGFFAALLRRS